MCKANDLQSADDTWCKKINGVGGSLHVMGIGISILLAFILILANGYFAMSEMALVNARKPLLEHDAEEGDEKARAVSELVSDPSSFLAAIQVAITLVGFFSSAVASTNLSKPFADWISSFGVGWLSAIAPYLAPILITLVVSYVSIVIGEPVPKRIALSDPEAIAKRVAGPLRVFEKIAAPLVRFTSASANGLARLLHIKDVDEGQVSEEELRYMVSEQEDLSDDEKRMIHEVFELGDTTARQVMVPRVDVEMVEDTTSAGDAMNLMLETGYSRLPVFHDNVDSILGTVGLRDLLEAVLAGKADEPVTGFIREGMFVPDTKDIVPLLEQMRRDHYKMAIVVDEYGGTAGIITIEDIVEEVVGEINDEFDDPEEELTEISERVWEVDGTFSVYDALDLDWPIEASEEYETVAGWLLDEIDELPEAGDVLEVDGWTFEVLAVENRRITSLRVTAPVM